MEDKIEENIIHLREISRAINESISISNHSSRIYAIEFNGEYAEHYVGIDRNNSASPSYFTFEKPINRDFCGIVPLFENNEETDLISTWGQAELFLSESVKQFFSDDVDNLKVKVGSHIKESEFEFFEKIEKNEDLNELIKSINDRGEGLSLSV